MIIPRTARPLILASASPRRRDLLTAHGCPFVLHPANVEEIAPAHLDAHSIVHHNALLKAQAVAPLHPASITLGVDTLVAFQNTVLGKPASLEAAEAMLARLNGQTHEVLSAVALLCPALRWQHTFVTTTSVRFHHRDPDFRSRYLARIGPLDKAGSYAAQDDREDMIAHVSGSMSNVIGLPMEDLAEALRSAPPQLLQ